MAILENMENDTKIILNLKATQETPSWLGYDLKILTIEDGKDVEFIELNKETLYFENENLPEVPLILDSLGLLSKNKISNYLFEPRDEKDFCLEIIHENQFFYGDFYRISLFMRFATVQKELRWKKYSMPGIQIEVSKEDLVKFSNQLRKEYEELMSQFKQK